jgi:alkylation response protein AidB-like acyl-CoA dehydrogenase
MRSSESAALQFPLTPAEQEFQQTIRRFCAENLPKDLARRVKAGEDLDRADYVGWQRILSRAGLLCGAWPVEAGGRGWKPLQAYLFDEECARAGAPWLLPFGVNYVGPVLYTFGSEAQKAKYLPSISSAETFWCQGYSEPGAGSDLASLSMRAVRDGDRYLVSGRTIWTTMAHWADRIFCLVRTDPAAKPQRGISFLLIDLKAPGVTVRPIVTLDGRHHLNEVTMDEVVVPVEDRVGEENEGWSIAKFLLGHERLLVAEIGKQKRIFDTTRDALAEISGPEGPKLQEPAIRRRLAELEVRLRALEWTALSAIRAADSGADLPAAAVSMLKVRGSEAEQALTEFAADTLGALGLRYEARFTGPPDRPQAAFEGAVARLLSARAVTIYGGSNEVQRNIIAKDLI